MRKRELAPYDALYSSNADESKIFESKKDSILHEGLGFYRFDSEVDNDIVDADDQGDIGKVLSMNIQEGLEFDHFGNKSKRAKRKEKRSTRRDKRKKEVRKFFDRQKQNVKDLIKDPKAAIKSGLKEVGRGIKQSSLAAPRGAALGLIRINVRGLATRIKYMTPKGFDKLKKKWEKLGGMPNSLEKAVRAGEGKHVFMCGSKCRSKLPKLAKDMSNFDGFNMTGEYHNSTGADVAAALAMASGILGSLTAIINSGMDTAKGGKELKAMNQQLKQQEDQFKAEEARKSSSQRKEEELAEAALNAQLDPAAQILANPNLTPEEKAAGIKDLNESLGSKIPWKPILIGTGVLAVIVIGWLALKKR
tara:strand:- start:4731 stop:5816 length:1086 start_codon:yes stop_codon:yes gene_type:complete